MHRRYVTTGYHYTHDRLKNYLFQLSHAIPFVPTSLSSGLSSRCNTDNCTIRGNRVYLLFDVSSDISIISRYDKQESENEVSGTLHT